MADNVTISQQYLETLLRRAELHESDNSVKISLAHYQSLNQDAVQLQCLKAALIEGGASKETLDVLIKSQNSSFQPTDGDHAYIGHQKNGTNQTQRSLRFPIQQDSLGSHHRQNGYDAWEKPLLPPTPTSLERHADEKQALDANQAYADEMDADEIHADRSLRLTNIPDSVSLHDFTDVLRGGMVFNIYIRQKERVVHVSFVDPQAAAQFIEYSQRYPITIKNKRIKVRWDVRQAYIPRHVMHRILNGGATRNIVIRFVPTDMEAASIRDDLEHIYRLEVVNIRFDGGHAWIQLNSIAHAIAAKTCMQSRLKYRKSRIEFYADECDQPLLFRESYPSQRLAKKDMLLPAVIPFANRFGALSTESDEDNNDY